MNKIIENDKEHELMLKKYDEYLEIVMDKGEENTPKDVFDKMALLGLVISDYEKKRYPIGKPDPITAIKFEMEQRDLAPKDMQKYFGSLSRYYDIINGKRTLSMAMVKRLHKGLNMPYECLIVA